MELMNGFRKVVYMTKEQVMAHAKKYSKSFKSQYSAWTTDFGKMARKTPLLQLLRKWAPMSIEFIGQTEADEEQPAEEPEVIEITPEPEKKPAKKKAKPEEKPVVSKTETAETQGPETEPDPY
jgi:recombination protein RecT